MPTIFTHETEADTSGMIFKIYISTTDGPSARYFSPSKCIFDKFIVNHFANSQFHLQLQFSSTFRVFPFPVDAHVLMRPGEAESGV